MKPKPKVLIVDDNLTNIFVIEQLLADAEIEPVRATSGAEAIDKTAQDEFALVLMDVQMPGMDGFEAVENIRKNKKTELLPIIYITATQNENYFRTRGVRTGAIDFIIKPIIADLFIGKVNLYVNLYLQRKGLEEEIERRTLVEQELKRAKEIAEDAARAKQQFLSTMSHEIRTPLNAILNTANLLRGENPRQDQIDDIETLQFSADNLMRLINDILDFSKIDAGKFEFEDIDFELRKQLSGIRQSFEYEATKKNLTFEIDVDEAIPGVIRGDSVRLSQILFNLVGNALKFTSRGGITVAVSLVSETEKEIELQFSVRDTGIGIAADKQAYIFESFTQASSSTTRKYGGTGLGLAITKKLVELQGGTIILRSKEKAGSTFTFTLRFGQSSKPWIEDDMVIRTTFQSLKGLRVLVVEDNQVNMKIVSKFLAKWEAAIDVAENGLIAVRKVKENEYDLVLMDLHMPEMSGYEATQVIRQKEGDYYRNLPIIALTASAFLEDRDKIYSVGMNGYVIKPFNPTELYWKIAPFVK
jgi:signal transduction histidine kinase